MKVSFEFQYINENDEAETWEIDCDVSECKDAYGTGDSPTIYEVEDIKAQTPSGVVTSFEMSDATYSKVFSAAVREYRGD